MQKAYLKIIAGASLWGCIGLFVRSLTAAGLTSMETVALRGVLSALLYGVFLAVRDPKALRIQPKHWYYFFGSGVCSLVFFNWCYFSCITLSSLSVAAVLLYTSPIFVSLLSAVFFREAITGVKVLALAVTFGGCALVTGLFPLGQESVSPMTILLGLGAGFGYAMYSIFGKLALKHYPSTTITFWTMVFSGVFAFPVSGLYRDLPKVFSHGSVLLSGLGLAVFCTILPYLLYTDGLQEAEAGKAAILATVEPFVAAVLGVAVFHEALTVYKVLGMAAIFGAILLLNRPERARRPGLS